MLAVQLQGKEQRFESPSAFSIALKRLVNPLRKADDGWKTVKYNGRFLDAYKFELAQRRLAGQSYLHELGHLKTWNLRSNLI